MDSFPDELILFILDQLLDAQTAFISMSVCKTWYQHLSASEKWRLVQTKYNITRERTTPPRSYQLTTPEYRHIFPGLKRTKFRNFVVDQEGEFAYVALWDSPCILKLEIPSDTTESCVKACYSLDPSLVPSEVVSVSRASDLSLTASNQGSFATRGGKIFKLGGRNELDAHPVSSITQLDPMWEGEDATEWKMFHIRNQNQFFYATPHPESQRDSCRRVFLGDFHQKRPVSEITIEHMLVAHAVSDGLLIETNDRRDLHAIHAWDIREKNAHPLFKLTAKGSGYSLQTDPDDENHVATSSYRGITFWDRRNPSTEIGSWNRGYSQFQSQAMVWSKLGVAVTSCDGTYTNPWTGAASSGIIQFIDPDTKEPTSTTYFNRFVHHIGVVEKKGILLAVQSHNDDVLQAVNFSS